MTATIGTMDTTSPTRSSTTLVKLFRVIAIVEAFSWLGLLIGMYFKWIAETSEAGVKIFGPIHGGIFVAYLVITVLTARQQRWPLRWTTLLALGASIPPFFTVWFEIWAKKTGRLDPVARR